MLLISQSEKSTVFVELNDLDSCDGVGAQT